MKTCPACHRTVPDDAVTCPHPGCGHALGASQTSVKRPPPPPTHVELAREVGHPAPPPIGSQLAGGANRSPGRMLIWFFVVLVGSVLFAAGLVAYLPRSQERAAAPVEVAAQPTLPTEKTAVKAAAPSSTSDETQTSDKTARSKSGDDKTKPAEQPGKASQKDGSATNPKPAAKAKTSPTKPDESLGVLADQQKGMVEKAPTGVLDNAPRKPESLGVPEQPKLAVVADTPKGLYEERTKPKTPEWLVQRGGTIESQKAVEDGLNWLARHQGDGGHWGSDCLGNDPHSRCDQKASCQKPGDPYDVAHSGMALLAFQAAGHYYFNGQKYSDTVKKGLDYLVHMQAPDGSIVGPENPTPQQIEAGDPFDPDFMYEHAMATFALCEACAVAIAEGKTPEPQYQKAAEQAVAFIEKIQHDDGGWRYTLNGKEQSDCSVSGWVMLALKTAREAKVSVSPETISRMMEFFASCYAHGRTSYQPLAFPSETMTGVGMMAVEFCQHKLDSPIVQNGASYLADQVNALIEIRDGNVFWGGNYYVWYNCTMAMFQVGGEPWERWNGPVRDHVSSLQVRGDGCERGSWPPDDRYGDTGGRIYSTALAVLTLEVYYRFQRVAGKQEEEKSFEK